MRDSGSNLINVRGARELGPVELYAEAVNILGSGDKDITYSYESYIPSFDAAPTEGRLSRVVEPFTIRIGATLKF